MEAPWKDFEGNDIHDGDLIEHPSGEIGLVLFEENEWFVDYGDGPNSRLCLQIGDKGRAVVV